MKRKNTTNQPQKQLQIAQITQILCTFAARNNLNSTTMPTDEQKETKNRINYTVMIVRDFGNAHHLSPRQAHNYLRQHKAMEYIEQFYDVEHTLAPEDTVNTLGIISKRNGGQVA